MLEDLEQGDVAMTIKRFFESSSAVEPRATSDLTLQEVDEFLEKLSTLTKEDEQTYHFKSILNRCTADDLKMIIRLIKHDLRINAGPKHILGAVHDDAYAAFQASRDLPGILHRFRGVSSSSPSACGPEIGKAATLALMTPVLPMLAEPCKSVEMAMQKCPNGMLSEVKYDGERVQVHKRGSSFLYFSRSLKPVLSHKVNFLKEYIPKAFPHGDDLILDSEILMVDARDGKPLPFGSLGVHKRSEFKDANVCLFVFDIIYYNGESLLNRTMKERRKLLEQKMTPIENRIMLSETQEIKDSRKLAEMIAKVFKLRLEGLVLKDVDSKYEPGKRHWLKVKKDYLFQGNMADSADLVVLGAWYGTGKKGGIMSVFLMGCHDPDKDVWLTVTKVHGGHDDATLAELQTTLDMVKIGKDPNLLPKWLKANKAMVPDFVAKDPKKQPVWEITGAEFTNQGQHTADGISIRFPRVTRIRDDKDWKTATNLPELRTLFKNSADSVDYSLLLGTQADTASGKRPLDSENESPKRKSPKKQGRSENGEASTSRADYSRAATTSSKRPLNSDDESPRKKSSKKRRRFGDEASTSKPDYSLLLGLKTDSDSSKRPVKNNSKSKQGWSRAGEASTSRRDTRMSDDEGSCSGSDVNFSATTSKDIESKTNETKRLFTKKSPVKSSSKVISEYFKRSPEHTNKDELDRADVNDRSDEEGKAEFYSFIGMDYIEYSAAGSPLNWVEGRKPPKHLPKEAKPISERDEDKMRSRCLLYNTRIYLANDLDRERRQAIQRTLKTLGATVLPEVEQSRATYVIHGRSQVPSTILSEPTNVPKSARHVTESWIDDTAAKSKIANAENHAVTLFGVYCSCRCPHMED
ncbi:DNA ligase 3 [Copidosoma floridanum]|uniref:DNA ligase 3 n=1 Tax=Copidosoma floridanum TaxID=29053 RepID=UPI0006C9C1B9|nr:DNA ligase 3 [Copidosoma floridanum]